MTVQELSKVYRGAVRVTALAYFKANKKYYSFRTIAEREPLNSLPEYFDNEIMRISAEDGYLCVDILEWI